jgi:hypothetical protein
MSYRVHVTKIRLEYFIVDVETEEMEHPDRKDEASAMARATIKADPVRHQLGGGDTAYVTTQVEEY